MVAGGLVEQGISGLESAAGVWALNALVHRQITQASVLPADWSKFNTDQHVPTLLTKLVTQSEAITKSIKIEVVRDKLQAAVPEQRLEVLEGYLREEVAKVVRRSVSEITAAKPLGDFELNSLMGLELRNRLEGGLAYAACHTRLELPHLE